MNKKIREKFDAWDLKSFFATISAFLIGLVLFFYFSNIKDKRRTEDKEKYKGQTTGQIINIAKQEKISQGRVNGTRI